MHPTTNKFELTNKNPFPHPLYFCTMKFDNDKEQKYETGY